MEHSRKKESKTICIAFPSKEFYQTCMNDSKICREFLLKTFDQSPELFPPEIQNGFKFHGFSTSSKQDDFRMRRIRLKNEHEEAYQIRPSFMMPYMIAETDEVEKALYLRRWGVPFDGLAYVFGHDAMFWYRAYVSLGRHSVVSTTIKAPERLPEHVIADEKHTRHNAAKVYVATTVAHGCILGSSLASDAGATELTKAYGDFKEEAQELAPLYHPTTVNTDGWEATQQAWKSLFPSIRIILCFRHAFLKIKARCRRSKELLQHIGDKVWNAYHAPTLAQFSQRIRRLREWAHSHVQAGAAKEKVLELCQKASKWKMAFRHPGAYRTSNALDRLMNYQDRILYAMQYFHGTSESARLYVRSMALVWNFHPYGTKTLKHHPNRSSPFHDINGFVYHDNWLHNMLIAGSLGGCNT